MTKQPQDEHNESVAETQETENQENARVDDSVPENQGAKEEEGSEDESFQDRNWRLFRERREKERQEAKEAAKIAKQKSEEAEALRQALEALVDKPSKKGQPQEEYTDYGNEEEEDDIEKKLQKMLDERERKKEEEEKKKQLAELPQRLSREFKDFDQICSQENIDYFEYHYPEVAQAYSYMPDGYEKWSGVYKAIQRFMPEVKNKKATRAIHENLNKPRSASAPGAEQSNDSAPIYLDEDRRKANWNRMQRVMKGLT